MKRQELLDALTAERFGVPVREHHNDGGMTPFELVREFTAVPDHNFEGDADARDIA